MKVNSTMVVGESRLFREGLASLLSDCSTAASLCSNSTVSMALRCVSISDASACPSDGLIVPRPTAPTTVAMAHMETP